MLSFNTQLVQFNQRCSWGQMSWAPSAPAGPASCPRSAHTELLLPPAARGDYVQHEHKNCLRYIGKCLDKNQSQTTSQATTPAPAPTPTLTATATRKRALAPWAVWKCAHVARIVALSAAPCNLFMTHDAADGNCRSKKRLPAPGSDDWLALNLD